MNCKDKKLVFCSDCSQKENLLNHQLSCFSVMTMYPEAMVSNPIPTKVF